jgi:phosphoglycerate-specific signal transduction histidine kinase
MEEQLLQSAKLASIGKLTAGISHEIGNPLASISSLVQELLSEDKIDKDFIEESLKNINSHIERIARIVRSLSDLQGSLVLRRNTQVLKRYSIGQ